MEKHIGKILDFIKTPWVMVAGAVILFLIIKIPQIDYRYGDENIYFFMGKLITEGQFPYRDFFFASPPLQLVFTALFVALFGFHALTMKFLSLLTVAGSAFFLYVILKKNKSEAAGVCAAVLYLFSFVALTTSDYVSGVQLVVFFTLGAFTLIAYEKPGWAGIAAALALFTRFYAAPLIGIVGLYAIARKQKMWRRFFTSLCLLFIGGNLLLYGALGAQYEQSVVLYHLQKFEELDKQSVLDFFVRWDWMLAAASALSLGVVRFKQLALPLAGLAAGGLFLYVYKDIYYLYFNLIIPFLALLGGMFLANLFHTKPFSRIARQSSLFIALFLFVYIGYGTWHYMRDHAGAARIDYFEELVQYVRGHSDPRDSLYGSFEVTPLVAGFTERVIAGNFIDTNNKTFSTGMAALDEREEALLKEKVRYIFTKVLVDAQGNLVELGRFISRGFLQRHCAIVKSFPIQKDYYSNLLLVWECRYE